MALSSPLIWIVAPAVLGGLLFFLRRWPRLILGLAAGFALLLAWAALVAPIGAKIDPGFLAFSPRMAAFLQALTLEDSLFILGRRLVLGPPARLDLALIYFGLAFWLGGAILARVSTFFAPIALLLAALLTAAIAVRPFVYAPLLIALALLGAAPLLSPPGRPATAGLLRLITQATLSLPFLLLAGWLIAGSEGGAIDSDRAVQVIALLGFGFALLTPFFPLHSWLPMLGGQAQAYTAAFVFFFAPGAVALFGRSLLLDYPWLAGQAAIQTGLVLAGTLLTVAGGLWAVFERHLGRLLGYAAVIQVGLAVLGLALLTGRGAANTAGVFFALFLPRAVGMALWALALGVLQSYTGGLTLAHLKGQGHNLPAASASLVLAGFSLAGFPLLAGFPAYVALWMGLTPISQGYASLALLGAAGLLAGSVRALAALFSAPGETPWQFSETWPERILFFCGCLLLFLLGLAPQVIFPVLLNLARF